MAMKTQHRGPERTLRSLTGHDEIALDSSTPTAALDLVARLAPDVDLPSLDVTSADRLVARLYTQLYGDTCDCRAQCHRCHKGYAFELSLSGLIEAQDKDRPAPDFEDGSWSMPDGRRVRSPRVSEIGLAPEQLTERLVAGHRADATAIEFLERAAPTLALDLDATCPHCHADQEVRFDLALYLVQRLSAERPFLIREVHLIASRYGWSLDQILDLSRDDRRAFAALIQADGAATERRRWAS